ncbi:MAG: pilus biogenesis protein [Fimbriimonadales bacterium]|nr:MAG: pilus biogenesis protein [Fimbriimonadales bacterium]
MILCDTGPLVAVLNRNDPQHARCAAVLRTLPAAPLLTTVPCLVEAMYLLRRVGGAEGQSRLWQMRQEGKLVIYLHTDAELDMIEARMRQYKDVPMDFADASLVVAAESLGLREIFTLDNHFYAYRVSTGEAFIVYPRLGE